MLVWLMRKNKIFIGEYYHVFNRGVDKRVIFKSISDYARFLKTLSVFNTTQLIGSLHELECAGREKVINRKDEHVIESNEQLVEIVAYCLLSNHFHLVLREKVEGGISRYMKRVSGGYSWYFNNKYKRTGALFEGRFKAVHISNNFQLLHVSAYVNLNHYVKFGDPVAKKNTTKKYGGVDVSPSSPVVVSAASQQEVRKGESDNLIFSSWKEYTASKSGLSGICTGKHIVLDQFKNSPAYERFALDTLKQIQKHKELVSTIESLGNPAIKSQRRQ